MTVRRITIYRNSNLLTNKVLFKFLVTKLINYKK